MLEVDREHLLSLVVIRSVVGLDEPFFVRFGSRRPKDITFPAPVSIKAFLRAVRSHYARVRASYIFFSLLLLLYIHDFLALTPTLHLGSLLNI